MSCKQNADLYLQKAQLLMGFVSDCADVPCMCRSELAERYV
jgi:hypothetical protein